MISASEDHISYVDEVTKEMVKQAAKKLNLRCTGTGGSMPDDIQSIQICFHTDTPLELEQARLLEVEAIELFHEIVNQHEKIRPYLREYPFSLNRCEISITAPDNNQKVCFVFNTIHGNIHYRKKSVLSGRLEKLTDETIAEAQAIVHGR